MAKQRRAEEEQDDYEVGYGRPPREHQFKPGQSGNPNGRPKGSRNTATLVREMLDELVEVIENGKRRRMTKREVMLHGLFRKATNGDVRALKALLELDAQGQRNEAWPEAFSDLFS